MMLARVGQIRSTIMEVDEMRQLKDLTRCCYVLIWTYWLLENLYDLNHPVLAIRFCAKAVACLLVGLTSELPVAWTGNHDLYKRLIFIIYSVQA